MIILTQGFTTEIQTQGSPQKNEIGGSMFETNSEIAPLNFRRERERGGRLLLEFFLEN
jgi:hypothetical protein